MKVRRSTQHVLAAIIAASALVLSACGDTGDPDADRVASDSGAADAPTDNPSRAPGGLIPDDFPLAAGWPDSSEGDGLAGPSRTLPSLEFSACDQTFAEPEYVDRLRADWNGPEDYRARQLTMYDGVESATAAVAGLADLYRSCEVGPARDDGYRTEYELTPVDVGDQGWAVLQRDTLDGAQSPFGSTTVVVRVATAVLILDIGGHAGYPDGDGQDEIAALLDDASEPIDELPGLQTRLDDGARDEPATPTPTPTTAIPADFPLAAYPSDPPSADSETTVVGPDAGRKAVGDLAICGVAPLTAKPAERLGYQVEGIEWGDARELRTYATADAAVAELQSLRDRLAGCDREPSGQDGWSRVWRVFEDADPGYDSVTYGYTDEMDDSNAFAPAGVLTTVIRVGHSILIVSWYAEYSAQSMARNVPHLLETVGLITPSMCTFTAAGC